ncbi:ATP dependent DNA ligase [Crassisporium funariophilum]|nr:ATP dependent DNA ligase [Crassisporium funariophilum]
MAITLQRTRGVLALVGSVVDDVAHQALKSEALKTENFVLSEPPYHITLLTKDELKTLAQEQVSSIILDARHVFPAGIGGKPESRIFWVVIIWAAGTNIRKQLGLPPKQFHITLSVNDKHDVNKGITSLLEGQFPEKPSADFLDHLVFTLQASGQYQEALFYCSRLILHDSDTHKGFLRMADAALGAKYFKLAMLSYACAYGRTTEENIRTYCVKKLIECSKETEWGMVLREHEITQLDAFADIGTLLLAPWLSDLRQVLSDQKLSPSLLLEPRHSLFIPLNKPTESSRFYKLPRFFRWLIPFHLAIMSTPRNEDDITALSSQHLDIRHVLTLTEETPLNQSWFQGKNITNTFLPVPNFHPPSIEQMDLIIRLFDDHKKLPLLVHCGGGKGRAGTVAACYLAAFGFNKPRYEQDHPELSASEAISLLRSLRPGSLETSKQEAFVSKWCSTIWKRQSVYLDLPSEPVSSSMEIEGTLGKENDLFILVGLPGSGKSWLSKSLLSRDSSGWVHICQDDSGGRSSCETEIGRTPGGKQVLLDRCNTSASDRKLWLSLASNWCESPVCIFFDYDRDLCISRAQMRAGHPTLPPGSRVRNAVDQMLKVLVRPTLQEGFKAIITIRSFAAAREVLLRLSPPSAIYKFPRTPHLINMGAATLDDIHSDVSSFAVVQGHVVVTEKIDGANMGFSLSSVRGIVVQNRSHYVNPSSHEQFKKLGAWLERHQEELMTILDRDPYFPERYILFGEWMFATHSIAYTHLPDHFIAYDLFDRSAKTWVDTKTLRRLLEPTTISTVPIVHEGRMPTEAELLGLIQQKSRFYDGRIEGVYVKVEANSTVRLRGKVVRSDFIAGNEHWTRGGLRVNGLQLEDH